VKTKEAELKELDDQLKVERTALDRWVQEALLVAIEALWVEQRNSVQGITSWADEASTTLVPLGMDPIQAGDPSSIADALLVLDSAAEWLWCLDTALGGRLEAEGRELCRAMAEHALSCFWSHNPSLSLAPVIEGPVADAEISALDGVPEAVEIVAARFQRAPPEAEEALQGDGDAAGPQ